MSLSLKPYHFAIILAFLVSPLIARQLTPNIYDGGRSRDEFDRELRNSSAIANILGEVRANFSDLLFIKTERYLHAGVAYEAHIDMEHVAATGEIVHRGEVDLTQQLSFVAGILEHESEVGIIKEAGNTIEAMTLIPPPDRDFRGFIGHLHRRVKPWLDPTIPHVHTTGKELLPWYRLMTLADPTNVRAYMIGAFWLQTKREEAFDLEALAFIEEGIRFNPGAFQLHMTRGDILRRLGREDEAIELWHKSAELALNARPEGANDLQVGAIRTRGGIFWTHYMEEDARRAMRTSVLAERNRGNIELALKLGDQYQKRMGGEGDFTIARILHEIRSGEWVAP